MSLLLVKSLVAVTALLLGAGQPLCATWMVACAAAPAPRATTAAVIEPHDCCKTLLARHDPSDPSKKPCEQCEVMAAQSVAIHDGARAGVDSPAPAPLMLPAPPTLSPVTVPALALPPSTEQRPPPLLSDLFHSSCLLTI